MFMISYFTGFQITSGYRRFKHIIALYSVLNFLPAMVFVTPAVFVYCSCSITPLSAGEIQALYILLSIVAMYDVMRFFSLCTSARHCSLSILSCAQKRDSTFVREPARYIDLHR